MGALSHLRIVEIGSAAATSYCARLFADFGANVLKVEPPDGDPLRRTAPLTPKGQSAWFAFLNFNKSSVALDRKDPGATSRLTTLIEGCDILLDGRDVDAADCPAFDLAAIKRKHPGLIHVEAGWFGKRGSLREFRGDRLDHPRLDRADKTRRTGRGTADACAGFPDGHLGRPMGLHRRGVLGAEPHAGRTRPREFAEHLRVQHRGNRIHHVRVVFARRRHAANRRQPVLADLSGRHLRDQAGLARRHHGDSRAMARVLRDAGPVGSARRSLAVPRRRPSSAHGRNRSQVYSETEAAHRAGMVCGRLAAKNSDRAGT